MLSKTRYGVFTVILWAAIIGAFLAIAPLTSVARAEALTTFKTLSPELALKLARETLKACRESGYQVAVSVVDRSGILQVTLRDQLAGMHTPETARRKAWTAVTFRTDTMVMEENTKAGLPQNGVRFVADALMVGGGVPVEANGAVVGGIGVSGAPGGDADDKCARVGIEAIVEDLEF
ncbi:MAG: heme-binding protein [Rhodospirillaceae bacterium]|jgi:uncharacterized protein GlcG (DUF336 family)|nr:heme-binding protein [Rhodospirillaceae bacterium]MBT5812351.1 heme-binding protein [Rhodospirillaceae bacterium]